MVFGGVLMMADKLDNKNAASRDVRPVMRDIILRQLGRVDLNFVGVDFKIASSPTEIAQSIDLVDNCYVSRGILEVGQKRASAQTFLTTTTILIAVSGEEVIGTVSLVEDSPIGLPMEETHSLEVRMKRHPSRRCAEVGSLAVSRRYRNGGLSMMLYSMLYRWARFHRDIDDLLISVHPSAEDLYCNVLHFQPLGEAKEHKTTFNTRSTPLYLNLNDVYLKKENHYDSVYLSKCPHKNLYAFFNDPWEGRFDFTPPPREDYIRNISSYLGQDQFSRVIEEFSVKLNSLTEADRIKFNHHVAVVQDTVDASLSYASV